MEAFPVATDEEVAMGMVAFCTPAPREANRRLGAGEDAAETRPFWSQSRCGKSRIDSTAPEKRIVCKVYQKLNEWVGRWKGESSAHPVTRGEEWFAKNRDGPIREITAHLLGLSSTTVGEYWEGMHDSGGVLTSAKPRGSAGKSAEDLAINGYMPEEGSLYDLIKGRMAAAHESGEVSKSRNLPRWATDDEDGPRLPRVGERFPREILARAGFEYTKRGNPIADVRGNHTLRAGARPIAGGGRREYWGKRSSDQESSWMPPLLTKILPENIHGRPTRTHGGYCMGGP